MKNEIVVGHIRVQFLSDRIVRIERDMNGKFCDENTLFIPERGAFPGYDGFHTEENVIAFGGYRLKLPQGKKSLNGLRLTDEGGKLLYQYKKSRNSGELPAPDKTPEVFAVYDNPRLIVPDCGYSSEGSGENSGYRVEENAEDVYLILCNRDCKLLRQLYVQLTGRSELVRLSTLGLWDSRYYAYSEQTAMQRILDYEARGIPLDNLVIDTDWRAASERGIGYDVDKKLFPDMKRFLDFAHSHGVDVMFNDHPEPVEGASSVLDHVEVRYREEKLQSLMKIGLDTWWYDRNWSTKLISPVKGILPETIGMYLFQEITKHFYQQQANSREIYRRPDIMGNVSNMMNGLYFQKGGLKIEDTASHRFSIQWTGDIDSDYRSLTNEIHNLILAGNNDIAYVNSDCGGHIGNPDSTTYIRWMQFGALSPVHRPHCAKAVQRTREPWAYDDRTLEITKAYILLRYRLLPVIYQNAFHNYRTGEPIFKSLAYEYPTDKRAAAELNSYMLGRDLLISPVNDENDELMILPEGDYAAPVTAEYFNGIHLEGEPVYKTEYKSLCQYWNRESPNPKVPACYFSARYETVLQPEEDIRLFVLSDDGVTVWIDGEKVLEDQNFHGAQRFSLGVLEGGKAHTIKLEYFQAEGEAGIALLGSRIPEDKVKSVYLPKGKWMDVFDGKIYGGGRTVRKQYPVEQMGLFVRLGALIPLAYAAKNTKEQKWDNLVYDLYPCRDAADQGYLYEDDTQTTAYKLGQYRICRYETGYDAAAGKVFVNLSKCEGSFAGDKAFSKRRITLKFHMLPGFRKLKAVHVDGQAVPFETVKRDPGVFPLNTALAAPDADIAAVSLTHDLSRDMRVDFIINSDKAEK